MYEYAGIHMQTLIYLEIFSTELLCLPPPPLSLPPYLSTFLNPYILLIIYTKIPL